VVLPCGHTYVCNECANKLDKCMECRTSLAIQLPGQAGGIQRGPTQAQRQMGWSSDRSGGRGTTRSPDPAPLKPQVTRRLPLPKNVVLLSLMEATALTLNDLSPSPFQSPIKQSVSLDEYEIEEEKIKLGTTMAIGVCGTYVVAATNDVHIFPSRPTKSAKSESFIHDSDVPEEEDVDTLVRFFHMDHKLDMKSGDSGEISRETAPLTPVILKRGDRVQIVSLEEGWAKLARGYGFIRAESGQVVKVGGSVDRACKLEAMLINTATRRRTLHAELIELDTQFIAMMRDLQYALTQDEDLTVIGADTFNNVGTEEIKVNTEERIKESVAGTKSDDLFKPHRLDRQVTPPILQESGLVCFSVPNVFCAFEGGSLSPPLLATPRRNDREEDIIAGILGACSQGDENSILDQALGGISFGDGTSSVDQSSPHRQSRNHPSPRALSAGARAWRERNGREPSFGVDFRTGFSGHMALTSTHAQSHDDMFERKNTSRKMSSHSGLNLWRPSRGSRRTAESSDALNMPSFTSAPSINEGNDVPNDNNTNC